MCYICHPLFVNFEDMKRSINIVVAVSFFVIFLGCIEKNGYYGESGNAIITNLTEKNGIDNITLYLVMEQRLIYMQVMFLKRMGREFIRRKQSMLMENRKIESRIFIGLSQLLILSIYIWI